MKRTGVREPFGLSLSKPSAPRALRYLSANGGEFGASQSSTHPPFGLSLSKPWCPLRHFDKLSANGGGIRCYALTLLIPFGLRYRSPLALAHFDTSMRTAAENLFL